MARKSLNLCHIFLQCARLRLTSVQYLWNTTVRGGEHFIQQSQGGMQTGFLLSSAFSFGTSNREPSWPATRTVEIQEKKPAAITTSPPRNTCKFLNSDLRLSRLYFHQPSLYCKEADTIILNINWFLSLFFFNMSLNPPTLEARDHWVIYWIILS